MTAFSRLQRQFAGHLRDPGQVPAPTGVGERRMAVYRELAFNNVANLLAASFPVLRSLQPAGGWQQLVRAWYRGHRARTPLFPALGGEFVHWLEQSRALPDWQVELADYEWTAIRAGNDPADIDQIPHDPVGDLMAGRPLLSPLVWPLRYRHAVHRAGSAAGDRDLAASLAGPTCLIIVRDRRDQVGFLATNALTLQLVERLRQDGGRRCGRALLQDLASASGIEAETMLAAGGDILLRLRRRDIILGTAAAVTAGTDRHG